MNRKTRKILIKIFIVAILLGFFIYYYQLEDVPIKMSGGGSKEVVKTITNPNVFKNIDHHINMIIKNIK